MTFLQKTLGKNYKWLYLLNYEFKRSSGHFYSFIFVNIIRSIEFLTVIFVWLINGSTSEVITYLALGRVFERIISSSFGMVLGDHITTGRIVRELLRPQSLLKYYFVSNLGFNQFRSLLGSTITLILAFIVFHGKILPPTWNIFYLLAFLPIAILLRFLLNCLIGMIAFWIMDKSNNHAVMNGCYMIMGILAGEIIPLALIFQEKWQFLQFSPFAYFLHLPMQIYLGKYNPTEVLLVFLGGIFWFLVLYFLAKKIFQMGLKKNESVGL